MAYELRFLESPPALLLAVEKEVWSALRIEVRGSKELREYLGGKSVWVSTAKRIGFGRCGDITEEGEHVRLTFPLSETSLRRILLSLSFLLQWLYPLQDREDSLLIVQNSCGNVHPLWGYVSAEFRKRLKNISPEDESAIIKNMGVAFMAVVPKKLRSYADECYLSVYGEEQRFALGCFGNACDMGTYPDQCPQPDVYCHFGSHNLDSDFQQATLLAGLATLAERIKNMK